VGAAVKPGRINNDGIERKDDYIDLPTYDCMAVGCDWRYNAHGALVWDAMREHIISTRHNVMIASVFEVWGAK